MDAVLGEWLWWPTYSSDLTAAWSLVELMRERGYLTVIKRLPVGAPYLIPGSRSEFDAPMDDRPIGTDLVCCSMEQIRGIAPGETCFAETPALAICRTIESLLDRGAL